ncbi:hypothetical protein K458DRAFT_418915 [Lentithecium fluviatile CBS 122367]|uniref:Uncharacterized protein n=1 Tax=Lentithecium fluviatile CBS 122367 TaxID=1168545 RepID=A0A6G1IYU2_9PLEO|nr:hypothetical protein K458DRAFT_418915 [Lentithecium fluviatile CBS 122367]
MHLPTTTAFLTFLTSLASSAPTNPFTPRQPGVEWHAVGNLYSGGGCTSQSLIFADPIWGAANQCHPLDRFSDQPPIVSYKTTSVDAGCNVTLFYDFACSVPAGGFAAGLNGCVQGNSPFESAIVTCP